MSDAGSADCSNGRCLGRTVRTRAARGVPFASAGRRQQQSNRPLGRARGTRYHRGALPTWAVWDEGIVDLAVSSCGDMRYGRTRPWRRRLARAQHNLCVVLLRRVAQGSGTDRLSCCPHASVRGIAERRSFSVCRECVTPISHGGWSERCSSGTWKLPVVADDFKHGCGRSVRGELAFHARNSNK